MDAINTVLFNNPVSQKIIGTTKSILFKNGNGSTEIKEVTQTVAKTVTGPTAMSLFDQGGRPASIFIRLAGLSGATAVILGAYGAHTSWVKDPNKPNRDPKAIFETANRYHFFHSLALMAIPISKRPYLTGLLMTSGMVLFSGTCYYAALTNDERYNRLAPIGGTLLILGWMSLMFF
ncbi:transmembrane protein 256 homolog [Chironomus tepperi]|uniref:transmembrane protein 256 homolog n=1 Tax=Chironomus tepperi TaxID=113505 RepID=UPI00391F38F6